MEGYRVLCVDSRGNYPNERYAAVFVRNGEAKDSVATFRVWNWGPEVESFSSQGYKASWFDINTSSGTFLATVYRKGTGGWWGWYGMTDADFSQQSEEYRSYCLPVIIRAHGDRLAAIWSPLPWFDSPDIRTHIRESAQTFSQTILLPNA